jgi:hypothetical protein
MQEPGANRDQRERDVSKMPGLVADVQLDRATAP